MLWRGGRTVGWAVVGVGAVGEIAVVVGFGWEVVCGLRAGVANVCVAGVEVIWLRFGGGGFVAES